ncbi:alpha/beta hydrolase [Ideonella sp.]|uniref:alpha/beta hydrolase n=1 Tax=Ideonella sp. TaxID=1929293 RepID=UPI0035B43F72
MGLSALLSLPAAAAQRECTYQVQTALQYGTGTLEGGLQLPLLLDAYLPVACADGPPGAVPPVVLIPGGGFNWVQRDRPRIVEIADGLARAGFAVFSIEHRVREQQGLVPVSETLDTPQEVTAFKRRIRHSPYPGDQHFQALVAMEDGLKAVAWVRDRAQVFGLDAQHLGLLGGSSGACTVLGMAYSADEMLMSPLTGAQAVVDMWGDFYPHTDLKSGNAPVLVLAGTEDPVIPYEQTTDLVQRARRVGVEASRITMPGVKHGLDDADIFHREIVGTDITVFEAIVQFLEARLRPQGGQVWPPTGQRREMTADEPPPTP